MARNGSGVYTLPAGSDFVNGDTANASSVTNALDDLATDANTARPVVAGGTGATTAAAARTNLSAQAQSATLQAIADAGGIPLPFENVTGNTDVEAADRDTLFRVTSTATLALLAASTATAGFAFRVYADGADATIDPNDSETINGSATLVISDGEDALVWCDGTNWLAVTRGSAGADFSAVAADIIPDADSTRDLGSASIAWALAYIDAIEPVGADTTIKRVGGTNATPIVEGIVKAWVNFNGTGTIAARDSLNLSSLTDNGTGNYLITVTSAFGAADFNSTAGTGISGLTTSDFIMPWNATPTASTINITTWNGGQASLLDSEFISVSLMGELA